MNASSSVSQPAASSEAGSLAAMDVSSGANAGPKQELYSRTEALPSNDGPNSVDNTGSNTTRVAPYHRTRTVPLKVLSFGLGRTGSSSLRQAFFTLGYRDAYHYMSLFESPSDIDLWLSAMETKFGLQPRPWSNRPWSDLLNSEKTMMDPKNRWTREQWDKILGNCMAVSDLPALCFIPELMEAYPEAKIIITVRDPNAWHRSYATTLWAWHRRFSLPRGTGMAAYRWFANPSWPLYSQNKGLDRLNEYFCRNTPILEFPEKGKEWYAEHVQMVKRLAREQGRELLEFDVKKGWEPLCSFLGEEVPREKDFPKVFESAEFVGLMDAYAEPGDRRARRNMGITAAVVVALGAVAIARWKR